MLPNKKKGEPSGLEDRNVGTGGPKPPRKVHPKRSDKLASDKKIPPGSRIRATVVHLRYQASKPGLLILQQPTSP